MVDSETDSDDDSSDITDSSPPAGQATPVVGKRPHESIVSPNSSVSPLTKSQKVENLTTQEVQPTISGPTNSIMIINPSDLSKEELILRLNEVCNYVQQLQSENTIINNKVTILESEIIQIKLDFAEATRRIIQPSSPSVNLTNQTNITQSSTNPMQSSILPQTRTFAKVIRHNLTPKTATSLVVKCSDNFAPETANLSTVDDLLNAKSCGPVPVSVRK